MLNAKEAKIFALVEHAGNVMVQQPSLQAGNIEVFLIDTDGSVSWREGLRAARPQSEYTVFLTSSL